MAFMTMLLGFVISLVISSVVIYLATKLLGETEGFGTAVLTALIGTVIYSLAYYLIGTGWIAALVGGVAWLIALGSLYKIGWLKSFVIAVVIWIFASIVGLVLPTIAGPL